MHGHLLPTPNTQILCQQQDSCILLSQFQKAILHVNCSTVTVTHLAEWKAIEFECKNANLLVASEHLVSLEEEHVFQLSLGQLVLLM